MGRDWNLGFVWRPGRMAAIVALQLCNGATGPGVTRASAAPLFDAPFYSYPTGSRPNAFVATDLDGDGAVDLLVATGRANAVAFWRGRGDSTFEPGRDLPTGSPAPALAVADVNNDGHDDVIVARDQVVVLPGNGHGDFAPAILSPGTGSVRALTIADWNGDHVHDLLLLGSPSRLLLGAGDGTFKAAATTFLETATAFAAADFDEDGRADLATSLDYYVPPDLPQPSTIAIQLGHGDGTFGPAAIIEAVAHPRTLAVADFDGDGHLDIVVGTWSWANILHGDGRGGFTAPAYVGPCGAPVTLADVDHDGRIDAVGGAGESSPASVCLNRGGTFEFVPARLGWTARSVVASDLNADGWIDLVGLDEMFGGTTREVILVAPGHGDGRFADRIAPDAFATGAADVADFDFDGVLDVAFLDLGGVQVLRGSQLGTFEPLPRITVSTATGLAAGDFDGDGYGDVALTCWPAINVSWLRIYPRARDAAPIGYALSSLASVTPYDFNGDGRQDFLLEGGGVDVVQNRGRSLGPHVTLGPLGFARAGDVDGDGKLDVVTAWPESRENRVVLQRGHGDFTFAPAETIAMAPAVVQGLDLGDFDGDGVLDLALAHTSLAILRGRGDGRFDPLSEFPMEFRTGVVRTADFDGDGDLDCVVSMPLSLTVALLSNRGDGTFESRTDYGVDDSALSLRVVDLNGDGAPDIVAGTATLGSGPAFAGVTVLRNQRSRPTPVLALQLDIDPEGIRVSWSLPPGFTPARAVVQRADRELGPWNDVGTTGARSLVDATAGAGLELWYRVLLVGAEGAVQLGPRSIRSPAAAAAFSLQPVAGPLSHRPVTIAYDIRGRTVTARLAVYDARGSRVWATAPTSHVPGHYERTWNPDRAARGVYFVRLEVGDQFTSRKLVLTHR